MGSASTNGFIPDTVVISVSRGGVTIISVSASGEGGGFGVNISRSGSMTPESLS